MRSISVPGKMTIRWGEKHAVLPKDGISAEATEMATRMKNLPAKRYQYTALPQIRAHGSTHHNIIRRYGMQGH